MLGSRRLPGKVQLSSKRISNTGEFPRPPLSKYLLIPWQIICTFIFQQWILRRFFFFTQLTLGKDPDSHQIVKTNAAGIAPPLFAELGPLPLFLENDGFYSVLGYSLSHSPCEDYANGSSINPRA